MGREEEGEGGREMLEFECLSLRACLHLVSVGG